VGTQDPLQLLTSVAAWFPLASSIDGSPPGWRRRLCNIDLNYEIFCIKLKKWAMIMKYSKLNK
jgi:hypothetical protein